jgi:hypothetical protein
MEVDKVFFQSFFTLNDLDVQTKLIYLSLFPSNQLVTPKSLSEGADSLITFKIEKGDIWADILFAGWAGLHIVSERTRDVLSEAKGVDFIPVNILDEKLQDIDVNYYRVQVSGKSGPLVKELSREELSTRFVGGPQFVKRIGLYFTPGSWDGNDFFTPKNTMQVFVTKKVKELIDRNQLTNFRIDPITEVEAFFV